MKENVKEFIEKIANGTDVMVAANKTGVFEMNTHDLLSELSVVLGDKQFSNLFKSIIEK